MKRRTAAITLVLIGTAALGGGCERKRPNPTSTNPADREAYYRRHGTYHGYHAGWGYLGGAGLHSGGSSGSSGKSSSGTLGGTARGGFGYSGHGYS